MNKMQKGFTLIELMIVVAIIAILAAIALPAYQDYTVRSKVSELIVASDACKTNVTEYFVSQGTLPTDLAASGCSNNTTKYIASTGVASGVITITASDASDLRDAAGDTFVMTPTASGDILQWSCTASSIDNKYLPASCR